MPVNKLREVPIVIPAPSFPRAVCAEESENRGFAPALETWLEAFPREQLLVLQYENLSNPEAQPGALAQLKQFLGLDLSQPEVGPGGWWVMAVGKGG